jgi:hypothetical protein
MRWLPALLALAAACGQEPPQIAVADAAVDAAAPADGAIDAIAPVDASAECVASADALAAEIFEMFGGCTAVVRLGFQDRQVLGYGLICGIWRGCARWPTPGLATPSRRSAARIRSARSCSPRRPAAPRR